MGQKRGINISTNILGDFNTSQKLMKKVYRKIYKKVEANNTTNQFDLTFLIYSNNSQIPILSSEDGTFILGHKINKFKRN